MKSSGINVCLNAKSVLVYLRKLNQKVIIASTLNLKMQKDMLSKLSGDNKKLSEFLCWQKCIAWSKMSIFKNVQIFFWKKEKKSEIQWIENYKIFWLKKTHEWCNVHLKMWMISFFLAMHTSLRRQVSTHIRCLCGFLRIPNWLQNCKLTGYFKLLVHNAVASRTYKNTTRATLSVNTVIFLRTLSYQYLSHYTAAKLSCAATF